MPTNHVKAVSRVANASACLSTDRVPATSFQHGGVRGGMWLVQAEEPLAIGCGPRGERVRSLSTDRVPATSFQHGGV